ncbi:MAG: pilus assembly protein FimV [Urechidicola sp.]
MRNLKLIIIFWLASFAMPGISFALGLGEIDVSSFLNQPLKAEIEVISARPGEIDDLLVSLASRDSFARAGLSRSEHLLGLRFEVKKNENSDQATILVTTKDAIKEPFLNFLVEADWSKGRVLREFTVLLDPPFFADSAAPAPSSTAEEIAEPIVSHSPVPSEVNTARSTVTAAPASVTSSAALDRIVVKKGDALWTIASQFKDPEHSMGQVMLAMQRANPTAFSNNNINNLKIGAVLRAPTADELDQLNKQEAYALVLEQNGLWDAYVASVTGTSVSIASGSGSSGADGEQNVKGNLSLLTSGNGDSESAGEGEGGDARELKNKLALAEEQLDAARIEKQEMQSRIADLEARLSKFDELQKMVEIEDDSLAQLQSDQAKEVAIQSDLTSTPEVLVEEDTVITPPAAVIVTETKQKAASIFDGILPPGIIDLIPSMSGLLDDPIALGGLGGVAILLLGLILYRRSKSGEDKDDAFITTLGDVDLEEASRIDDDLTPVEFGEGATNDADSKINTYLVVPENVIDEDYKYSNTEVTSSVDLDESEPEADDSAAPAEQDDVLNEVDVYLAYGLYDNAEELLKQSLDTNPNRADYRSKLLDTYFATKNADGFSNEAVLLKAMGSAGVQYWEKVQTMGYELAPDNALFSEGKSSSISAADLEFAKPEMADFDLGASENDTNFSDTDFNLSEDRNDFSDTQSAQDVADTLEFSEIADLEDVPKPDNDLHDELGALEFTLDGEDDDVDDISDINFDVSDDLSSDSELNLDLVSDDDGYEPTAIINAPIDESVTALQLKADLNQGMDVISPRTAQDDTAGNEDIQLDRDESGQKINLDSDLLDLGSDGSSVDVKEDLALDDLDDSIDIKEDSLDFDMDLSRENEDFGTGTFAPGDFDDPDETMNSGEVDIDDIGDLMLPDDVDEVSTKLDLARAFIDMGDAEGARGSLEEVLAEGTDEQKAEASELLEKI